VKKLVRSFKIDFIVPAFVTGQLLLIVARIDAGVDANGNALPGSSDGKSMVVDNSKETPPVVPSGCVAPADTEFRVGIPGWMAGLSGDFGVRGFVTDQDVKFADIFKRLDMIATGSLYARYHRWEISADGLYMRISDSAQLRGILFSSVRVALKSAYAEGFVGYRVINCEQGYLSLQAGARYNYMSADIDLRGAHLAGRNGFASTDWVDPVIGAAGKVHVWKPVSLWAKGDIGGFGAASDFTWQVQGGVEIQMTRSIWTALGWRYMKFDYTSGGFTNKTALNGPYIESGINF
jgi:opacity protein-like surface antigen